MSRAKVRLELYIRMYHHRHKPCCAVWTFSGCEATNTVKWRFQVATANMSDDTTKASNTAVDSLLANPHISLLSLLVTIYVTSLLCNYNGRLRLCTVANVLHQPP